MYFLAVWCYQGNVNKSPFLQTWEWGTTCCHGKQAVLLSRWCLKSSIFLHATVKRGVVCVSFWYLHIVRIHAHFTYFCETSQVLKYIKYIFSWWGTLCHHSFVTWYIQKSKHGYFTQSLTRIMKGSFNLHRAIEVLCYRVNLATGDCHVSQYKMGTTSSSSCSSVRTGASFPGQRVLGPRGMATRCFCTFGRLGFSVCSRHFLWL